MRKLLIIWLGAIISLASCAKEEVKVSREEAVVQLSQGVNPLETEKDLDVLLNDIGDAHYVLLGEASHGTSEYYTWRAEITKRLISEKGFSLVVVEGDWPASYRLNNYIKGTGTADKSAAEALQGFTRWPSWMWANEEIASLSEWLREYNATQAPENKAGFYGMDVYSLWESLESVQAYLSQTDPEGARAAQTALQCLAPFRKDEQEYASATYGQPQLCVQELARVMELIQNKRKAAPTDEVLFNAEQNALVAVNAARYYREMIRSGNESWNVRDRHMVQTINRLNQQYGTDAKVIVWAHNTHVGDARATDMAKVGMVNVGQLLREQKPAGEVYIVGFGTYHGSVIAASAWGAGRQKMQVPNAPKDSWEGILHRTEPANKIVLLKGLKNESKLMKERGNRAIGVVYDPSNERGNYVPTILPQRYDAFIFIDRTEALHPLPLNAGRKRNREQVSSF